MQRNFEYSDSESGPSAQSDSRETSTASKHYVSAPFLMQGHLGRRVQASELLVVDTPPSYRTNPPLQGVSPPLKRKQNQGLPPNTTPKGRTTQQPSMSAFPPMNGSAVSALDGIALPRTVALRSMREGSHDGSTGTTQASNTNTSLSNASAPSLPYTWTDSYLEESPEATRARWMQRQTFGPVLQSEGGNSSTVASTPRAPPQDGEAIWGGVLARNAEQREGNTDAWRTEAVADVVATVGRRHPRRVNLEASEHGGEGLRRAAPQQQVCVEERTSELGTDTPRGVPYASSAAKALFHSPANTKATTSVANNYGGQRNALTHLLSNTSTVIATVQQPRRGVQVAPVERQSKQKSIDTSQPSPPQPQVNTPSSSVQGDPTHVYGHSVGVSTSATVLPSSHLPNAQPGLRASQDVAQARSPTASARDAQGRVSGRAGSSRSSSSTGNSFSCEAGEKSSSDVVKTGGMRASRNGPIRRRVLKPIYDD
ncbi:hypothetical protein NQL31_002786 [Lotmaria passim]